MLSDSQLRRNMLFHWLDGLFFSVAAVAFSMDVIIPAMIRELTPSATLLGCVPLIAFLGNVLPQALYAKRVEGLPHKQATVLKWVVAGRTAWLLLLVSFFVRWSPGFTLPAFFVLYAIISVTGGLLMPVWTDWYAKTTPESGWSRVLGLRTAASGVSAITLGFFATWALRRWQAPARFEVLLGVALLFYALSTLVLLPVKEERVEGEPMQHGVRIRDYLRDMAAIALRRRDFRRFMIAVLLTGLPSVLMGTYLTSYGLSYPDVDPSVIGTFMICLGASVSAGALLGGVLGDRFGPLAAVKVSALAFLGAAAAAMTSPHPVYVGAAFAALGFSRGLRMPAMLPAVFRYAGPYRRPTYIAAYSVVGGVSSALVPPLAGGLVDAGLFGLPVVFGACGAMCLTGFLVLRGMQAASAADG